MVVLRRVLSRIDEFRKVQPGSQVWVCAKNLNTGARIGVGENERVRTASTIKLPVLCAAYRLASEGKLAMDEMLTMKEEDKSSGSGIIREFDGGKQFSVRDLLHVMIVVSDNTATNLILDRIGADYVNGCMDHWGLPATRSMRKVRGDGTQLKNPSGFSKAGKMPENERFGIGSSTPGEMVALLEKVDRGQIVSAEASKEIVAILKRQQYKHGIGRHLDSKMPVASKSGSLDRLRSDVGIVYPPGARIAIAATVDDLPQTDYSAENPGNLLIADLSDILVDGLNAPS